MVVEEISRSFDINYTIRVVEALPVTQLSRGMNLTVNSGSGAKITILSTSPPQPVELKSSDQSHVSSYRALIETQSYEK